MARSGRGSDAAASQELHGRERGCGHELVVLTGRRAARDPARGCFLRRVWVAAMESTIAIHSVNGLEFFDGCGVAVANEHVFRFLFPSIPLGKVPSFRGSRQKTASVVVVV